MDAAATHYPADKARLMGCDLHKRLKETISSDFAWEDEIYIKGNHVEKFQETNYHAKVPMQMFL
jgi:hypothetical protein